jgi:hypothetical protein
MISLSGANVRNIFNQVKARRGTGFDGIPGHLLRAGTEQLADIFMVIFIL